jgi:hypothetical protein
MATSLKLRTGDMVGYVTADGAQSIIQPALAYAPAPMPTARRPGPCSPSPSVQAGLRSQPQYAIVPR